MGESLYTQLIKQWLPTLVLAWESEYNGQNQEEPIYLHDKYSSREYSVDGTFGTIDVPNTVPMAYVIDMDSPNPLIRPEGATLVTGEIPKIGAEMQFTEKKLTELHTLNLQLARAQGRLRDSIEEQLISKLFKPMKTLYLSQKERLEFMFKQGMSYGVTTTNPTNNVGANVQIDFGYKAENKFFSSVIWGQTGYTPITDLRQIIKKAQVDRRRVKEFLMEQETYDQIIASEEAKGLVFPLSPNLDNVPLVDPSTFDRVFFQQLGARIQIVINDNQVFQSNGVNTPISAWKSGTIVAITEDKPCAIVWAQLAENLDRTLCADYQTIEEFIMLKKYKQAHPVYGEFDSAQSRSLVVVKNNNYTLDTKAVA